VFIINIGKKTVHIVFGPDTLKRVRSSPRAFRIQRSLFGVRRLRHGNF